MITLVKKTDFFLAIGQLSNFEKRGEKNLPTQGIVRAQKFH